MGKLLTGENLLKKAKKLGVNTEGELITQSASGRRLVADEATLQRRLMEAENHIRQNRLWLIALISAIAAVVSAISSGLAVAYHWG